MRTKQFTAGNHTRLTTLIVENLSLRLQAAQAATFGKAWCALPVYAGQSGLQPTIKNTLSQRALLDAIDEVNAVRSPFTLFFEKINGIIEKSLSGMYWRRSCRVDRRLFAHP